eukprot:GFUD01016484.1.p1 GENE.GFUD01016484.1~~GFUD01016484.1.p1  ORF type:complete len:124 (+),score=21.34 GFUD01016484.1:111-482(+)
MGIVTNTNRKNSPALLYLFFFTVLLGCATSEYITIDCPASLAGKVITELTWECHSNGSSTCTETRSDCFYCDPFGYKRVLSNKYDENGDLTTGYGGWDCSSKCSTSPGSSGTQSTKINKQTRC